jgi:hypothetical protein
MYCLRDGGFLPYPRVKAHLLTISGSIWLDTLSFLPYPRVKAHLLKVFNAGIKVCPSVTNSILQQLQTEVAVAEERTFIVCFLLICILTGVGEDLIN